jgi:hypothetical protein
MRKLNPGLCPFHKPWVPHISLVFREMWDTTNLNLSYVGPGIRRFRAVVSAHPRFVEGTGLGKQC